MSDPPASGGIWTLLVTAATGPTAALLHESNVISPGPTASLWPVLVIVLVALIGLVLGLSAGRRSFPRLRWLLMIPNGAVLLLYASSCCSSGSGEAGRLRYRLGGW